VGNHEFDQGFADLTDRILGPDGADWDYLGANVYEKGTQTPVLPEYALFDKAGLTVAVIGAVTQETPSLVTPTGVADLDFGDPVEAVNRVAGELTDGDESNGEADVIVANYHEGAPDSESATVDLETELAKSTVFAKIVNDTAASVDAIFTGHTHQSYVWDGAIPGETGKTRPVLQTGSYGANIGHVVLTLDAENGDLESYTAENVARTTTDDATLVSTYPRVAAVKGIVDAALAYAAEVGNQPVGSVTADITTAYTGGSYVNGKYTGGTRDDRASESALGNLVADSLVDSLSPADRGGATIGVVNPGGLRAELLFAGNTATNPANTDGVITYSEANAVLPFVNNLWTTSLTGAQFKTVLEQQWQTNADGTIPSRAFLKLGLSENVRYTYDDSRAAGDRVTGIWIDGQPIDPAASYRIGSFNFLLTGGDNFREFVNGTDTRDSGLVDRDAWIAYLGSNPGLTPSFERNAVKVTNAPTEPAVPGDTVSFDVSGLDLTSQGAPQNATLTATWTGSTATFEPIPVVNGAATVSLTVPADAALGSGEFVLTAQPSGTVVHVPVSVVAPIATDRIGGATRYDVAVNTSKEGWPEKSDTVYVVSGEVFADALSAAPAAAAADAPILLTTPNGLPPAVKAEIERLDPSKIVIVGGVNSVNASVETTLKTIADDVTRIAGADRYEVSRNVAKAAFPDGAPFAVLATGATFADALSAGAAVDGAGPVILVNGSQSSLDAATEKLLADLDVADIVIAGGPASVSSGIYEDSWGITHTVRLGGADRYAASRAINAHFFEQADRVLIATGVNFPDALGGSAFGPKIDAPLFTVPGTCVPAETLAQIRSLGAERATLLGGPNTLSEAVENLAVCP